MNRHPPLDLNPVAKAWVSYKVKQGETIYSIAEKFAMPLENLQAGNTKRNFRVGDIIMVWTVDPDTLALETAKRIDTYYIEGMPALNGQVRSTRVSMIQSLIVEQLKKMSDLF